MKLRSLRKRVIPIYRKDPYDPHRRLSVGVILFYLLFLLLLVFAGAMIYFNFSYAKGLGYVEAQYVWVQSLLTARIQAVDCAVLDNVEKGQPLVRLDNTTIQGEILNKEFEFEIRRINFENQSTSNQVSQQKSLIDIENKAQLTSQELAGARSEVHRLQDEYDKIRKMVESGVVTLTELKRTQEKLYEAQKKESLLTVQYQLENQKSKIYKSQVQNLSDAQSELPAVPQLSYWQAMLKETVLYAPIAGHVAEIYKNPGEVIKVGESAMKIYDVNTKFVRAQFSSLDVELIRPGAPVDVHFKNGQKTGGTIQKVFTSATPLREEFQQKYMKPDYFIVADIEIGQSELAPQVINTEAIVYVRRDLNAQFQKMYEKYTLW